MWFLTATALAQGAPPPPAPAGAEEPVAVIPLPRLDLTFESERVRTRVLPTFPPAAIAQGIRLAGCPIRFYLDEQGVPTRVVAMECDELFAAPAVEAGMQWRFHPHVVDGVPRRTSFTMLYLFEYRGPVVTPPAEP